MPPEIMHCEGHTISMVFLTKRHNLNLLIKKTDKNKLRDILQNNSPKSSIHQSIKVITQELSQTEEE